MSSILYFLEMAVAVALPTLPPISLPKLLYEDSEPNKLDFGDTVRYCAGAVLIVILFNFIVRVLLYVAS